MLARDGTLQARADTPTLTLTTSRGTRHDYDGPGVVSLLAPYAGSQSHGLIEESQAMPGQGVRSIWTTGYGDGLWLGVLAALQMPHTCVRPQIWKQAFGLSKDKEQCRLRA